MVRTSSAIPVVVAVSASLALACNGGGGGDDDDPPDARPPADAGPDAAPDPLCLDAVDATCGYAPEPVTTDEISLVDQQALAERFNPAMVFTGDDIWPVSVDYMLGEGGPLMQAEHDGRVNFSYEVDEGTAVAVDPQPVYGTTDYSDLPTTAAGGRGLVYYVDGPGTNTGPGLEDETWSTEWVAIQGTDPAAAPYGPLQYAHLFWLSKPDRLLAIQYWFYYPYDKFTNNHEGDWEHVNVVLRYPASGEPTLEGAHFSLHGKQLGVAADQLYRVGDGAGGDHVVVFAGGEACQNFVPGCWCGATSGGSFPWPGRYDLTYKEDVAGTTTRPGRRIGHDAFTVVLMPRVEDVDFAARPELSWYALPFLAGEPTTDANAGAVIATHNHRAPVGPHPEHGEYDVGIEEPYLGLELSGPQPFDAPSGWTFVNEPPPSVFRDPPTNNNCTP